MSEKREAERIIRQAAVILKRDGHSCETPGCRYRIRFADGMVAVTVSFPDHLNPGAALAKAPFYAEYWEDEIHDMMAIAVKHIMTNIESANLIPKPPITPPSEV